MSPIEIPPFVLYFAAGVLVPFLRGRIRAALILMVRQFPDTLDKLSALGNQAA